ncbi:hypothetical protein [Anabaena azotica]|uniref:hypothetical protein n=1 Tax=Anabaena azotica TaxID=197653 RepID=UPI0039A60D7C
MPERNYPPAYFRYLKARLSNFLRPSFWGTGFFLVAVALVVRAYWSNPGIFTVQPNQEPNKETVKKEATDISEEDKAIAADIDNMPTLFSDFAQATLSTTTINVEKKTEKNNSPIFVEDEINQQNVAANEVKSNSRLITVSNVSSPSAKNPFVVQTQHLLKFDRNYVENEFLGINNITTLPSKTSPTTADNLAIDLINKNNQHNVVGNTLGTTIQQSLNTNQTNPLDINIGIRQISPNNSLPNQALPASYNMGYIQPTVTNQPQNSYTNFNNLQATPNKDITTNVINPVPNNPYLLQPPNSGVVNSTTPIGSGNYSNNTIQQPNLSYPGQMQQVNNGNQR